jgi:CheY-like chemotaxis protein
MYSILIVDDEEAVRYGLRELLSKYGYLPAPGGIGEGRSNQRSVQP